MKVIKVKNVKTLDLIHGGWVLVSTLAEDSIFTDLQIANM